MDMSVLDKIHEESMKILSTVGFKIVDKRILEKLEEKGFRIDGNTVFFTEEQIMEAVNLAPTSFKLKARNSKKDIIVGEGMTKLASGYGCTFVTERNGTKRDALLSDFINFAKLVHSSGCLDFNGGILVQPADLEITSAYPIMLYATLMLSDLPIIGVSSHEKDVRHCMELAEIAFGGAEKFRSDYHILSLVNVLTPLQLGDYGEETMLVAVEYNQPIIITPGVICGGTAPVSLAGALALANAETLATITVVQTLKPGLPVVYGPHAPSLDMKTGGFGISSPTLEYSVSFARKISREKYNIPCRNGGGLTNARKAGIQSTFEGMIALQNSIKEKGSMSIHATGILESFMAMSYEKFMIDCEAIKTIRKSMEPIDLDEEAFGLEAIEEVGIGGNYLSALHTVMNFRDYAWDCPYGSFTDLAEEDPSLADEHYMDRVQKACKQQIENYVRPEFDQEIRLQLEDYLINKLGADKKQLEAIMA